MTTNPIFKNSLLKASLVGVFILSIIVFIENTMASSIDPLLQERIRNSSPDDRVAVIIMLSDQANLGEIKDEDRHIRQSKIFAALRDKADKTQGALQRLLRESGIAHTKNLWLVNGIAARVPSLLVNEIALFPGVRAVTADAVVNTPPTVQTNAVASEWNIDIINAPSLWSMGFTGQNVVVANVDTGVDIQQPAVSGTWRAGTNSWYNPYSEPDNAAYCAIPNQCSSCELNTITPCDVFAHGTGTMGIMIGGFSSVTNTAIGVAPGANWIAGKGLNDKGSGATSIIIEALQWLLNPDANTATADAPDIINNSWGSAGCYIYDPLLTAIQNLRNAEIAVVFSAGNYGPASGTGTSPAIYSPSFSVGSTNSSDLISAFSSRGPNSCDGTVFPDVVAPGENILLVDPRSTSHYSTGSGTSFAAPHVAGALALLKSAFPSKKVADLESALMLSAVHLDTQSPNNTYGYGRIDVLAAYNYLIAAQIDVSTSAYNFGNIGIAKSAAVHRFSVMNKGGSNLKIGTILIVGTDSSQFSMQSDTCSGQSIEPKGACTVSLVFSPTTLGIKSASLSIPSNAQNTPTLSILLNGVGSIPPSNPIGVFRNGAWYLNSNANFAWDGCGFPLDTTKDACLMFGMTGDIPVVGDWNGDGISKIGVFRNGNWYLDSNGNNAWDAGSDGAYTFGMAGDIPVVGDWNGDGISKIGVFRNGNWYLDSNGNNAWDAGSDGAYTFGMTGDIPVVGDWNGDGISKIGVFRNGNWYLDSNGNNTWDAGSDGAYTFGMAGDIPVVGDWNGDGISKIGVFRNGNWYVDYNGDGLWNGCGTSGDLTKDVCVIFGLSTDIPIAGKW